MYRIPKDINLAPAVGQFITQFCVGEFDLQFTIGEVHFAIQSEALLYEKGAVIGGWRPKDWPHPRFQEILNRKVVSVSVVKDNEIVICFDNGIDLHIYDNSDQYESMQISIKSEGHSWVI